MKKTGAKPVSFGAFAGEWIQWSAQEIKPGIRYPDEPSAFIPPGWYVTGHPVDDRSESAVLIAINSAHGPDGEDLCGKVAEAVAAGLNGSVIRGAA